MTDVEWRDIPGYEGRYQASNDGRIKSLARTITDKNGRVTPLRERILRSACGDNYRYYSVGIQSLTSDRYRSWKVHRLVALAFLGQPPFPGAVVCHNDGDSTNNRVENLRWGSHTENCLDTLVHGSHQFAQRPSCSAGHEFTPENTSRRRMPSGRLGARVCLECKRGYQRRYRERKKLQQVGGAA